MPTNSPQSTPITSPFNPRSTALDVVKGISLQTPNQRLNCGMCLKRC